MCWITVVFALACAVNALVVDRRESARNGTFDYVVVGGGTAGLAIASRLSEFATVAVIEAGGYYEEETGNSSVVPLNALTALDFIDNTEAFPHRPLIDWELLTVPQVNAGNRKIHYAQGKTLGGSSAINTMAYGRSAASAYQKWADLVGDKSYTFSNLLPYFKKSAHLTPPNLQKRNAANATPEYDPTVFVPSGRPLQVSWNNWVDPTISWLAKCLQSIGLTVNPKGFSSGDLSGGAWIPGTIDPRNATRSSSETSYLQHANHANLVVYTHSQASKILFHRKKASGVELNSANRTICLSANKEVIVSAGVFHSPQLLLVSGIGPKSTLESLGIEVVADLPGVGQNLADPVSVNTVNYINTPNGQSIIANPSTEPEALREYKDNAKGPYSSVAGYLSFERLSDQNRSALSSETRAALAAYPDDWPDLEYIVGTFLWTNGTSVGAISATTAKTFSRGNVTINSTSMSDPPIIDLGWLSNSADAELLIAGVKRIREAWKTDAANTIRLSPVDLIPDPSITSDADLFTFVTQNVNQIWHASSTCSMGKKGDRLAVVDSRAKVFGVKGLRVVDHSVFPLALPDHPQSSVYMFAEKIAAAIKNGK